MRSPQIEDWDLLTLLDRPLIRSPQAQSKVSPNNKISHYGKNTLTEGS